MAVAINQLSVSRNNDVHHENNGHNDSNNRNKTLIITIKNEKDEEENRTIIKPNGLFNYIFIVVFVQ